MAPLNYQNPFLPVQDFNDARIRISENEANRAGRHQDALALMEAQGRVQSELMAEQRSIDDARAHQINMSILEGNKDLLRDIDTLTNKLQLTSDEKRAIANSAALDGVDVKIAPDGTPTFTPKPPKAFGLFGDNDEAAVSSQAAYNEMIIAAQESKKNTPEYIQVAQQLAVLTNQQRQLWEGFVPNPITSQYLQARSQAEKNSVINVAGSSDGGSSDGSVMDLGSMLLGGPEPQVGVDAPGVDAPGVNIPDAPLVPSPVPSVQPTDDPNLDPAILNSLGLGIFNAPQFRFIDSAGDAVRSAAQSVAQLGVKGADQAGRFRRFIGSQVGGLMPAISTVPEAPTMPASLDERRAKLNFGGGSGSTVESIKKSLRDKAKKIRDK